MSGHTPGPWRHEPTNGANLSYVAVSCDLVANGSTVVIGQCAGPDREANARMIAAAPELLDALQVVRMSRVWHGMSEQLQELIKLAIAKATGELP